MAGLAPAEAMGVREPAPRISYPHGAGPPSLEPPHPGGHSWPWDLRGGRARAQGPPTPHPRAAPPSSAPSAGSPSHPPEAPRTWFPPALTFAWSRPKSPGVCLFFSETFEDAPDARRVRCVNSVPRRMSGAQAHHRAVPHMSRPGGEPARCVDRAVFGSRGPGAVMCVPAGGRSFIGSLRSLRLQVVHETRLSRSPVRAYY